MKKILVILTAFLSAYLTSYSQCTPGSPTGTPGVTPTTDNVPCIERGVPYDVTMQLENFSVIQGLVVVNWVRIDSLVNFPCGISWQANKLQFNGGETGCIRVSGTTNDSVGQYPLGIYMTVNLSDNFGLGQTIEQGGEIGNLISQIESTLGISLGIDIGYYSRVIETGTSSCPAIDRSITANNLYSSSTTCQAQSLSVSVSGNNSVCPGASITLTATPANANGSVTYSWSPGGQTTASITVSPTNQTTYSVTATDQNGSASASKTVTINPATNAAFTASASGNVVTVSNTSTAATSYSWNFGNGATSSAQIPPAQTYSGNGTYTIRLITTNSCGSDTATQNVTILGVFVSAVEFDLNFDVYPNPSEGIVSLEFYAEDSEDAYDLYVIDLAGKTVFEEKFAGQNGAIQKQLDLSFLPKGTYAVQLSSSEGTGIKKLVIR